jgi:hypothetical protein
MGKKENVTKSDRSATVAPASIEGRHSGNSKPNGNRGGHIKPNGNKGGTDKQGGMDRPNGNNGGMDRPNSNRPGGRRHRDDGRQGERSFDPSHRYDYNHHHYSTEFRWNYSHHNWSRPLPPPARAHRPAPLMWRRPVIPAGWRPYASAPVIDRILGIVFGTLYYDSLNHLYCNGYYIDGYADDVIYLRDVPMLGLYWSDAMLNYSNNRFANAQFVYYSNRYDDARYNIIINKLSRIYGAPVCRDGVSVSWYGSDAVGFVTLSMMNDSSGYYTTLSIGY